MGITPPETNSFSAMAGSSQHAPFKSVKSQVTEKTIPMKLTWHGHSALCIEMSEAKSLVDSL